MDDNKLTELLATDARAAVEVMLPKYGPALQGIIFKIVGSQEVAEEVLQDTFIKIWKKGQQYNPSKGRLFTWMLNIARNTAIDRIRSKKFKQAQKSDSIDASVYNSVAFSEEMRLKDVGLHQVLDKLDPKYRAIIDLLYLQAYTQQEAANTLGIPLGTVKSRTRIALRELRAMLAASDSLHVLIAVEGILEILTSL